MQGSYNESFVGCGMMEKNEKRNEEWRRKGEERSQVLDKWKERKGRRE